MAADSISPIAPACVRVLVLPAGRIKRKRFMTFVDRLQHETTVRLGDISPDGTSDSNMFAPMAFPNGAIVFHFSTAMPPPSHLALTPFELFREPMVVMGIADAEEYERKAQENAEAPAQENAEASAQENAEASAQENAEASIKEELERVAAHLRDQYHNVMVRQLLIMDCSSSHDKGWIPDGAMCVPAQKTSSSTTMKTAMCDISAKFLAELSTYAKAVQVLPSVQSPGMSPNPTQAPHTSILERVNSANSRSDSPASITNPAPHTVSPTATGDSRSSSPQTKPPTSFDEMANAAHSGNILTRTISRTERDGSRTSSKDRISLQAFTSSNAADKIRNKGKARVGIVVGNLYMLAGRWSDAWRELVENTNKSRVASDYLWYAKGLESIMVCMLLFVWTGFDFQIPAICYSAGERSSIIMPGGVKDGLPSLGAQDPALAKDAAARLSKLVPDLIIIIMGIHDRGSSLGGEALPPIAYSESVIRMAKLLAILQNANGQLDSAIIGKIISGKSSSVRPTPNANYMTGLSKHAIAEILFRAYPSPSAAVPLPDATKILSAMASVLSMLGLERKKAIVIKELVASLVPALVQARKVGAAEMGIHPAASLSAAFDVAASDKQGDLEALLREVHSVYGARDSHRSKPTNSSETAMVNGDSSIELLIDATINAATGFADKQAFGSSNLKIDILRACIDFCEALPDLPGTVYFGAMLLRVAGPQGAVSASKPSGRVKIASEEQLRLISNMSRTANAASKIGLHNIDVPYWDDFLVRDVQWLESGYTEKLREHRNSKLDVEPLPSKDTPFLYDAFAKEDEKVLEKILVAEEPAEMTVTLQNPYDFDVRIEKLSLVTEGVALELKHFPFMLGSSRLQKMPFVVRAKGVGMLKIVGCSIKVIGCREQIFPVYQDAWSAKIPFRVKELGLSVLSDHTPRLVSGSSKEYIASRPLPHTVSSTVIQAQPHVVVQSTSLCESASMILEGQRKTFRVALRNTSKSISVDFMHITFEDSLTTSIRSALATRDMTRVEMHELQQQLLQDPIFTWVRSDSDSSAIIPPGETATFDITVVGRPGLGAAKVMFDYAYIGKPSSQVQGQIYTRQVVVPVDVTVNASIQLHRIDFAEFPSDFAWSNQHRQRLNDKGERPLSSQSSSRPVGKSSDRFRSLLDRVGVGYSGSEEHCLVLLDLRNAWPNPLTVSIEVRGSLGSHDSDHAAGEWKRAYSVHEVIHPGHIARLVLLLPKIRVSHPHAPIPLLMQNKRQFIVNAEKVFSRDVEMTIREQFWFREEVLNYIRGSWKEDGTTRQGGLDLRGIRLTPRMIDLLRLQDIDVSMTVVAPAAPSESIASGANTATPSIHRLNRSSFQVLPESFLTLRVKVHNRASIPIRGLLRLQPTLAHQTHAELALDVGRKFVVSGLLQQALPPIPPQESVVIEVGICPVVNGEFDIHALVEELSIPEFIKVDNGSAKETDNHGKGLDDEDFSVSGKGIKPKERRIWRAEEACRLVVGL